MNTKTCKKCGWVYPKVTPYSSCRFCGRAFTEGTCMHCGEYSYDLACGSTLCRTCYNKRAYSYQKGTESTRAKKRRHYGRICEAADKRFVDWKHQLKDVKTHSLTEHEWMETCSYFGGCALCDSDSIDARGYFIKFEDGGSYTMCNVIPLCDECATDLKYQSNPFRQMNPNINRNLAVSRGLSLDRLNRVAEYLLTKMGGGDDE